MPEMARTLIRIIPPPPKTRAQKNYCWWDGGLSGVSRMQRHRSEDPYLGQQKLALEFLDFEFHFKREIKCWIKSFEVKKKQIFFLKHYPSKFHELIILAHNLCILRK